MPSELEFDYKPIFPADALDELKEAIAKWDEAADESFNAAERAEKAVALTLGWVGVGEKVVALASAIIQQKMQASGSAEEKSRLMGMEGKLTQLADLSKTARGFLPGLLG